MGKDDYALLDAANRLIAAAYGTTYEAPRPTSALLLCSTPSGWQVQVFFDLVGFSDAEATTPIVTANGATPQEAIEKALVTTLTL
jgi:hypothetical protein